MFNHPLIRYLILFTGLLFSATSDAQFDISGEGKVYLATGKSQEFDFGFNPFHFRQNDGCLFELIFIAIGIEIKNTFIWNNFILYL